MTSRGGASGLPWDGASMSRSSIALTNLRAIVILIVLAFHSVLPYLASLPAGPFAFDRPPYQWLAFPIVDNERWFGFDLFCAWQDVGLMSLMFLLSGLFVPSSLQRKGAAGFLVDRLIRIGLPILPAVVLLAPLAYFAAYRTTAVDPGLAAYWQHWLALPFWPCGPQWFLGQLLAVSLFTAALYWAFPGARQPFAAAVSVIGGDPGRFLVVLLTASALAYLPLVLAFTPFEWTNIGPVSFQLSRPLHYLVYFAAGMALGTIGLNCGLLDCEGTLARRWPVWLAAALAGFLLWAAPTAMTMADWAAAPLLARLAAGIGFVVACAAGCLCALALSLRFAHWRLPAFASLSANAYRMYLIHYVFAVWLQYSLLGSGLFAIGKAAIVFAGTLFASWTIAVAWSRVSLVPRAHTIMRGARRA
jgi:acyltransferase-like protein